MSSDHESEADRVWRQKVDLTGSWRDIMALIMLYAALAVIVVAASL